jgi:hypothetical protein
MSRATTSFDRVRPRSTGPSGTLGESVAPGEAARDNEGKRALFTSAADIASPSVGSVLVECSRCEERTVLGMAQAVRVSLPSLHLGLRVGHGEDVRCISVVKHDYPTYLRCPACGRASWVRFTLQI